MPDREVSVNTLMTVGPVVDDSDYTLEESVAWNAAGMDLVLHEVAYDGGAHTTTVITLTTGGDFDWVHLANAYYSVEITGAVLNIIGEAWLEGFADGIYPFRSPVYNILPTNISDAKYSTTLQNVDAKKLNGATPNNISTAQVNTEADSAISDYDPPTKAELDTAESNIRGADSDDLKDLSDQVDGISGDATAANQVLLLEDLVDIKGTGFVKDTNSLVNLTPGAPVNLVITSEDITFS